MREDAGRVDPGRIGRAIPMLLPSWLATYPAGWLLDQLAIVPVTWPLRWVLLLTLAFYAADPDNDPNGTIVFAAVSAVVFYVAQELFAPPVPAVRGEPLYLLGPTLTVVGAYLLGYLVGYRDGVGAFSRWLAALRGSPDPSTDPEP
ncbi:hypothetical protein [Haloarchaeobius sp. DT45]|uniref:hypothetical protein n=1 Tax=Haloarchaeobius sp. DT45 TaxID=3446116 RepID=UPI003F6CCFB2